MNQIKSIPLENLLIDLQNPRYDPRSNQKNAIATIANDQGIKLFNLAEDIADKGLNPSELPMVTFSGDNNTFIVVEGNRRVAALKLLLSPSLVASIGLPENLAKRYKTLHEEAKKSVPHEINCIVLSREDANHWIYLRHTGQNEGIGIVPWDGIQTHRFRGSSPALQAIEFVQSSKYLDEETKRKLPKIAITNVERILGTTEAREHLGVDVKNGQLMFKVPEEEAIARLAIVVTDIVNKEKKVTDLDTKDQRINYAIEVASRPFLDPSKSGHKGSVFPNGKTTITTKKIPHDRKTLIPPRLKLAISNIRINKIYNELQELNVKNFVNSCSVLLRVFVELSVDEYSQKHKVSFLKTVPVKGGGTKDIDISLREKLRIVADDLENKKICTTDQLRGTRTIITNKDHVLSVDSLNAYVHNKDYNPSDTDLKTTWDNLDAFIQGIWNI
jgi:hypothetical protein